MSSPQYQVLDEDNDSPVDGQPARRFSVPGAPEGLLTSRTTSVVEDDNTDEKDVEGKKKKKSRYSRRQWAVFFSFCFINVCAAMCYSLQAPFYPREAENKGVSSTVYGFVFGVFQLVNFIACPIYGKNIRAIGPKFMLLAGIYVMSTCCILFGFLDRAPAGVPFVALSFAVRIVEALGQSGFVTASYAIIAQEFPDNVAATFSAIETMIGVGMIIGPTVGGVLYEAGGFLMPFAVTGSIMLVASFGVSFILPPIDSAAQQSGSLLKLLTLPGIMLCYYSVTAVAFSFGFNSALLEPHLRPFGLSPSIMGVMFVIAGLSYGLTATMWGYAADKLVEPKILCAMGAVFIAVAFFIIGPAPVFSIQPTLWLVILALVLHGIGSGGEYVSSFLASSQEAMSNGYPNNIETFGMVSGLWSSGLALGSFIGPSVAGVLNDAIGFRNASMVVVAMHLLVIILNLGLYYSRKRSRKPSLSSAAPTEESQFLSKKSVA